MEPEIVAQDRPAWLGRLRRSPSKFADDGFRRRSAAVAEYQAGVAAVRAHGFALRRALRARHLGRRLGNPGTRRAAIFLPPGLADKLSTRAGSTRSTSCSASIPARTTCRSFGCWREFGDDCLWRQPRRLVLHPRRRDLRHGPRPPRPARAEGLAVLLAADRICDGRRRENFMFLALAADRQFTKSSKQ